jgi:acyl carrier protein
MNKDDILKQAGQIIREALQCGPVAIGRETQAMDVRGWDSLSHTMILLQLEDGFGVRLPMDRVLGLSSVGELVDLISEAVGSAESLSGGSQGLTTNKH